VTQVGHLDGQGRILLRSPQLFGNPGDLYAVRSTSRGQVLLGRVTAPLRRYHLARIDARCRLQLPAAARSQLAQNTVVLIGYAHSDVIRIVTLDLCVQALEPP
jgi:hypothetical protein